MMTPTKSLSSGTSSSSSSSTTSSSGREGTAISAEPTTQSFINPLDWSKQEDCVLLQMMEQVSSAPSPSTWSILHRVSQAPRAQRSHAEAWSRYQELKHSSSEVRTQPQASEFKGIRATSQPLADEGLNEPIGIAATKVGVTKAKVSAATVIVDGKGRRARSASQKRREEKVKQAEGSGDIAKEEQEEAAAPTHEWTHGEDSLLLRLLAMRWGTTAFPSTFRFSWECLNCDIDTPCQRSDAEIRERCEKLIKELEGSGRGLVVQQEAVGRESGLPSPGRAPAHQPSQQRQQHEKQTRTKKLSKKATLGKKGYKKSPRGLSVRGDFTSLRVEKTMSKGSSKITVEGKGALRLRL